MVLWLSFKVDKTMSSVIRELNLSLRTVYILRFDIDRGSINDQNYDIMKRLKVGLSYTLMNALDVEYRNYQLQNDLPLHWSIKIKFRNFRLAMNPETSNHFKR